MPKLPIKKTEKLSEAEETGKLRAQQKAQNSKKAKDQDFKNHLYEWLGQLINKIDPLEAAAIASTTVLIQPIIAGLPQFAEGLKTGSNALLKQIEDLTNGNIYKNIGSLSFFFQPIGTAVMDFVFSTLGIPIPGTNNEPISDQDKQALAGKLSFEMTLISWLIAFLAAFIIVRYGFAMIKDLGGFAGITSLILTGA